MPDTRSSRIGRNEMLWVADGAGGHGAEPQPAAVVIDSLAGAFRFSEEREGHPGLRSPQLGALHAILAHRSMGGEEPVTIVMPTGTGKTETMLAVFAHSPAQTLVIVPSDALRSQIARKFATLGVLATAGAVVGDFLCPVVGLMKSAFKSVAEVDELLDVCNVVVATTAAVTGSQETALARLVRRSDRLFVDEAHHVAARTWRSIADRFAGKAVVQFTATPFREDGKHLGGRIAYAYPLRLAQERCYFSRINYRSVGELGDPDGAVAEAAIAQLRDDLERGLDHVLMARVQGVPRAVELVERYKDLAPDLNPVRFDSKMAKRDQTKPLHTRYCRIGARASSCASTCSARDSTSQLSRSRRCTIPTRVSPLPCSSSAGSPALVGTTSERPASSFPAMPAMSMTDSGSSMARTRTGTRLSAI